MTVQGEFRVIFKGFCFCKLTNHDPIDYNLYLSKKSSKVTEIKGNITFSVPFDKSINMETVFAVKGSNGGWIDNAHVIPLISNACDVLKSILGPETWNVFLTAFNISKVGCPIKPGIYISSGLDTAHLMNGNFFPKHFFYGDYKVTVKFLSYTKKFLGCVSLLTDFVRPWDY
ncbi:uncharacterized protein LOC126898576 isoform X2 [Daktulosphaira vitifoliae]|uniref:uncharacterized protein LOC126898576 isoform X2 n=1 Tax=Daktulosphaira vitifoliae TaxID=58002 RepID=UPI0021AA6526|nr:uncharacterized protein LOC126898576 isoform X2 [Daktulosphaira vitifoliae]